MTFPSCRDPEKIHLYLPGPSPSIQTNSLQRSRGAAGCGRPVIPWLITVLMPSAFPKKGGIPFSIRSLLHFRASVLNPRPASTREREFPTSDRTERIKIPNAFPWRNQPKSSKRKTKPGSGRTHPYLCLETIARNSEGRGRYKIRGNQHQTRSQKSMYRSSPGLRRVRLPIPRRAGLCCLLLGTQPCPIPAPHPGTSSPQSPGWRSRMPTSRCRCRERGEGSAGGGSAAPVPSQPRCP